MFLLISDKIGGHCKLETFFLLSLWVWLVLFALLSHIPSVLNFCVIPCLQEILSKNKMPAILALRVMLGLIHLFQLYASPIDKTILANGIV